MNPNLVLVLVGLALLSRSATTTQALEKTTKSTPLHGKSQEEIKVDRRRAILEDQQVLEKYKENIGLEKYDRKSETKHPNSGLEDAAQDLDLQKIVDQGQNMVENVATRNGEEKQGMIAHAQTVEQPKKTSLKETGEWKDSLHSKEPMDTATHSDYTVHSVEEMNEQVEEIIKNVREWKKELETHARDKIKQEGKDDERQLGEDDKMRQREEEKRKEKLKGEEEDKEVDRKEWLRDEVEDVVREKIGPYVKSYYVTVGMPAVIEMGDKYGGDVTFLGLLMEQTVCSNEDVEELTKLYYRVIPNPTKRDLIFNRVWPQCPRKKRRKRIKCFGEMKYEGGKLRLIDLNCHGLPQKINVEFRNLHKEFGLSKINTCTIDQEC